LYLKCISAGNFQGALSVLLGPDGPNLSSGTILSFRMSWEEALQHWRDRNLSTRRYFYIWANGIYFQACMED
jgi:putative transposase